MMYHIITWQKCESAGRSDGHIWHKAAGRLLAKHRHGQQHGKHDAHLRNAESFSNSHNSLLVMKLAALRKEA